MHFLFGQLDALGSHLDLRDPFTLLNAANIRFFHCSITFFPRTTVLIDFLFYP